MRKVTDWLEYPGPCYEGLTQEVMEKMCRFNSQYDQAYWDQLYWNLEFQISNDDYYEWADCEFGKHEGPVLIVGAGPSFYKKTNKIREAYDAGIPIIACDRILSELKARQINPLFVVSADPQDKVAEFFRDFGKEDTAVISITSPAGVLEKTLRGRTLMTAPANPFSTFACLSKQWYPEIHQNIRHGCVVMFSCIDFAISCGFTTINTIGNDLCYTDANEAMENAANRYGVMYHMADNRVTTNAFRIACNAIKKFPIDYPEIEFFDLSDGLLNQEQPWPMIGVFE